MNTDDVQRVYDALTAYDFLTAELLRPEVDPEAWDQAHDLWGASLDASRGYRERRVRCLAYLGQRRRPGDTIESILARLTDDELAELNAIARSEEE